MNIFNRILIVVLMLFLIVSSIVVMVNIFTNLFEAQDIADRIVVFSQGVNPWLAAAVAFGIFAVSLVILIFEFYRRKVKVANVASDQSGKTMVSLTTVSSQIQEKLTEIEDMINPKVKVVPMREGIIIDTTSKLTKGINVTEKTKEIRDTASDFASKNLGFRVMKSNYTAVGFIEKKEPKVPKKMKPVKPISEADAVLEKKDPTKPYEPEDIKSIEDEND